ncbi:MAG: acyl-CoA dehydrogenase [Alphaproteobacteria bacterium]|nr:acyl-CoA dehydrogenase [Alphaproteobacteria bacterium]
MSDYTPPVQDMLFILHDVLGFSHDELDRETTEAVLDEAAKLASGVLAPLNKPADEQGAQLSDSGVKTADGFKEAYKAYCEGGWNSVPFDPEFGGQGLPWAVAFPIQEMWQAANMSFGLCPLLNQGAVEAILHHGSDEQKQYYLPKLISGEWTGTMNLTEPQAGSDLGLLRSKAEKQNDGSYRVTGQKIFITYGDHDLTDNIIHLVLARTTDAPEDVKGISLFIVPKILEDGSKNSLSCIGLEHKLGIHASPTCTMDFDGATGYLIGEEHMGLKYMFTMMNNARLSVGLQGVAIADRALQAAKMYAADRVQGKSFDTGERVAIDQHPDVKRMLLDMESKVMAGRLMAYRAAIELDKADAGDTAAQARVDILTPIVKSWCTDMAVDVASTGIQVHGGMGFVEETGAAQYYRDARILPIYEGTNGIQAMDLVFRKVLRDEGKAAKVFIDELKIDSALSDMLKKATDKLVSLAETKAHEEIAWRAQAYLSGFSLLLGLSLMIQYADKSSRDISHFQNYAKNFARAHLSSFSQ